MELRELIAKGHELRKQLKSLQAQEDKLKTQLEALETDIKTRLDNSDQSYAELSEEEFQMLMEDLGDPGHLSVEVVYATREKQVLHEVQVSRGATIEDAILLSGILDECPAIDLSLNKVGVHGAIKPLSGVLRDRDRIEIYRPVEAK